jgi:hypothetical protein
VITEAIREELASVLNGLPNRLAITLKYATGPISMDKIDRDLKALRARVDRKYLGRHYDKSSRRSSYWAVAEKLDALPHVHTGWAFSSYEHAHAMVRLLHGGLWETIFSPGGGTHNVQVYDSDGYAPGENGWAGYAVKALRSSDNIIISC